MAFSEYMNFIITKGNSFNSCLLSLQLSLEVLQVLVAVGLGAFKNFYFDNRAYFVVGPRKKIILSSKESPIQTSALYVKYWL